MIGKIEGCTFSVLAITCLDAYTVRVEPVFTALARR